MSRQSVGAIKALTVTLEDITIEDVNAVLVLKGTGQWTGETIDFQDDLRHSIAGRDIVDDMCTAVCVVIRICSL